MLGARPVQAQASSQPRYHELHNTSGWFLGGELLGSLVVFAGFSIAAGEPAEECGWCETNAFDRSARRALLWNDSKTAGTLSHVFSVGLTPAVAFGGLLVPAIAAGEGNYALQDALVMLNVFVLVTGFADGVKKLADRQRPGFYYGREAKTEASDQPIEEFLSFFSGDSAWAFSLAAAGTTLAALRGYETMPYLAIGGGALALTAGVLRIAADMHWATDVLMGAVIGSATGVLLPWLMHSRLERSATAAQLTPRLAPGHAGLVWTHAW